MLVLRQAAIQLINFGAAIALARLLEPAAFGAYAIVMAVLVSITAFGDMGLGAALLQRGQALEQRDVDRNFTLTLAVALLLVAVFCAAVGVVRLTAPGAFGVVSAGMLCAAAGSVTWWAFRAPAAVQYEARLDYRRLAVVELLESVLFQATAVAGAAAGLGVWSFIVALNVRTLVGSLWLYLGAPLRPRLTRALAGARREMAFGVKYQSGWMAQSAASLALPVAVAPVAGASGLGLFMNASGNALRLNVMAEIMTRVGLPALAQAGRDGSRTSPPESAVLRVVFFVLLGWATVIATQAHLFTVTLFGDRWAPAADLLEVLALGAVATATTLVCGTALASRGRPGLQGLLLSIRLVLMFPALITAGLLHGLLGVAWASVAIELLAAAVGLVLLGRAVVRRAAGDLVGLLPAVGAAVLVDRLLPVGGGGVAELLVRVVAVAAAFGVSALAVRPGLRHELGRLRSIARR